MKILRRVFVGLRTVVSVIRGGTFGRSAPKPVVYDDWTYKAGGVDD